MKRCMHLWQRGKLIQFPNFNKHLGTKGKITLEHRTCQISKIHNRIYVSSLRYRKIVSNTFAKRLRVLLAC